MYASIRRYEGLSRDTIEEIIKWSREGFVPIIRKEDRNEA